METNEFKQFALYAPAFAPQLAQDKFGQLVAPIPGMSKIEYAAIAFMPTYIAAGFETDMAIDESIAAAETLLQQIALRQLNDRNDKPTLQIT